MGWGGQSQLIKCEKTAETKARKCWNLSIQIAASQLILALACRGAAAATQREMEERGHPHRLLEQFFLMYRLEHKAVSLLCQAFV
jgi:hypothetical protein